MGLGPGLPFEHLVHGADVDEVGLLVLGVHVLDGEGEAAPAQEAQRRAAARLPHVEHALLRAPLAYSPPRQGSHTLSPWILKVPAGQGSQRLAPVDTFTIAEAGPVPWTSTVAAANLESGTYRDRLGLLTAEANFIHLSEREAAALHLELARVELPAT